MTSQQTVGVALIALLQRYGVEHVFGIPGVHTIELYRGLADSAIRHHTPRHEQGAGFMADGYSRVSGKAGVCFVITGPGLTNIITPMGQALADSIPMLVISSVNDTLQTPHARGMLHEMPNQLALSEQVTRFSATVHTAEELPSLLARAFSCFAGSRPGPVHLQLPVSLLGKAADHTLCEQVYLPPPYPVAAVESVSACHNAITNSKAPVILAGGGARHAALPITELASRIDAPVLMTINGRGTVPAGHPLAVSASCTLEAARQTVNQSDLVIALGTELAATDYDQYKNDNFRIAADLIRCDIDPQQLHNNFQADIAVNADAGCFATQLLETLPAQTDKKGAQRAAETMRAAHVELTADMKRHLLLLEALRNALPEAIFVGDSTQLIYSGNMVFNTARPNHWFNSSVGFGTLGYALPAATGAAIAVNKQQPVVCIIGDGGLQFVLGELGALMDTGMPVAILVWCNQGYREIKTSMEQADVSTVGVEFAVPDYHSVASAYGIDATSASDDDELCNAVVSAFEQQQSVVITLDESTFMQS